MKKIFLTLLISQTIVVHAQQNFNTQVNQLLKESAPKDAFSGNVLIAKDGKVIYQKSAGYADWENKTPLNDSTLFNVGSIGKDFTQVVIAQLFDEGKLRFDDTLNKYLQLFPDSIGKKITIRMLLQHRSGLGDYHERPFRGLQDRLEYIKEQPLEFEPGTDQQYSNSGYVVLAAVIEKISGKSFEQNVRERIFTPLAMKHTLFIYPGMNISNKASGTMIHPNGEKENEHDVNDELTPSGDGGEYSTAKDLLKFYSSLRDDSKLLSSTVKENFFSRFEEKPQHTLSEMRSNKNAVLAYAGGLNGWNACADIYFGMNYIVISTSNFDEQPAEELNHRIHQIIMGEKYDAPVQPRFVFAYDQWKLLGAQQFTEQINELLKQNHYDEIQGPYFFNQIGKQLYNENHFDDAIIIFRRNTEMFPNGPLAYQWLGMSLVKVGRENDAYKPLKKCLELDPHNSRAQEILDEME